MHGHIHLYQVGLHDTDTPLSEYIYYKAIPRCNVLATILDITSVTQGYKVLYRTVTSVLATYVDILNLMVLVMMDVSGLGNPYSHTPKSLKGV